MALRDWAVVTCAAALLSVSAAIGAQQQTVTWTEAVQYVTQHGSASSFYGPVAKTLGLSSGTTVDYRVLSKPGDPRRDFYVTENAVVLSMLWKSGLSRGYTASKEGVLRQTVDRNTPIPVAQAAGGFEAERTWWIAAISAEKAKAASY